MSKKNHFLLPKISEISEFQKYNCIFAISLPKKVVGKLKEKTLILSNPEDLAKMIKKGILRIRKLKKLKSFRLLLPVQEMSLGIMLN